MPADITFRGAHYHAQMVGTDSLLRRGISLLPQSDELGNHNNEYQDCADSAEQPAHIRPPAKVELKISKYRLSLFFNKRQMELSLTASRHCRDTDKIAIGHKSWHGNGICRQHGNQPSVFSHTDGGTSPEKPARRFHFFRRDLAIDVTDAAFDASLPVAKRAPTFWKRKGTKGDFTAIAPVILDEAEYRATLLDLLRGKLKSTKYKDGRDLYAKLSRFAASRGFEGATTYACLRDLVNSTTDEPDDAALE